MAKRYVSKKRARELADTLVRIVSEGARMLAVRELARGEHARTGQEILAEELRRHGWACVAPPAAPASKKPRRKGAK